MFYYSFLKIVVSYILHNICHFNHFNSLNTEFLKLFFIEEFCDLTLAHNMNLKINLWNIKKNQLKTLAGKGFVCK